MARTVKDSKLNSRSARRELPVSNTPHWRAIHEGLHIGYRKGKRGGKWVARVYDPDKARYAVRTIATADDDTDADGIRVLDWKQAQAAARELATTLAAQASGQHIGPYTVADAMEDYHRRLEAESKGTRDSRRRTELYILPELGGIRLEDLRADRLREWLAAMAKHPGYSRNGEPRRVPKFETDEDEAEYWRRRKDSANRVLTILKAGLNEAFNEGKTSSNQAWAGKRLKPFSTVDKARVDYLDHDEVKRLVNAAEPGFRELVQGALYTGARYGDLAAMDVGDFNAEGALVMSGNSKGGRPHPAYLTAEGVEFFKRQTAGRGKREPMFPHSDGGRWGKSQQLRPMQKAVKAARIDTPITFHGLRHTYASHAVMAGVPLMVVAQNLGHKDTRMVEKHYGHLATDWVKEKIQAGMPSWGTLEADNVVNMGARA